ncbi:MAG: DUF4190 domain-containing protein [Clostridia bacterium]|nr:DUF4190 domain-containing protein [Clostridia bacterium]
MSDYNDFNNQDFNNQEEQPIGEKNNQLKGNGYENPYANPFDEYEEKGEQESSQTQKIPPYTPNAYNDEYRRMAGENNSYNNFYASYSNPYGASQSGEPSENPYAQMNEQNNSSDKKQSNGRAMAITSMVLGIVSLSMASAWYLSVICGIVGLILGIISRVKTKSGFALVGILTSAFGIAFGALVGVLALTLGEYFENFFEDFLDSGLNSGDDSSFDHNGAAIKTIWFWIKSLFR